MVGHILDDLFTSDEEKLDRQVALQRLQQNASTIQTQINQIEASHRSLFVAGWRPFIGWICGVGLLWSYLLLPILQWVVAIWRPDVALPQLPQQTLDQLTLAMLGLGGLRTVEKLKGRTK